jgi:hypothetical protein
MLKKNLFPFAKSQKEREREGEREREREFWANVHHRNSEHF